MPRYVVTGAAGFIGSHLVDALLARGDRVIGIDAFTDYYDSRLKRRNLAALADHPLFTLVEGNLRRLELPVLFRETAGIFHLAGQPGVRQCWGKQFTAYSRQNVEATQALLEAVVSAHNPRLVLASTSAVYGRVPPPFPEDGPVAPISPYGVSKLAAEHLAGAYASEFGLDCTILRYFSVYGPRQRPDMGFASMMGAIRRGEPLPLFGHGGSTRDYTYVTDAVAATLLAMERGPGGCINVASGRQISLDQVVQELTALAGRPLPVVRADGHPGEMDHTWADIRRAEEWLGFAPAVDFTAGLRAQWQWFMEQADRG